jgi:ferritin
LIGGDNLKNISDELYTLFIKQIGHEAQNNLLYQNIASYLIKIGLKNLGRYYKKAAEEELEHRNKLIDYLIDRNVDADIPTVEAIQIDTSSMLGIAQFTLEREEGTTANIKNMVTQSNLDMDYLAYEFLLSFLHLQRKEEAEAQNLVDNISGIEDDDRLLQIFDQNFEG